MVFEREKIVIRTTIRDVVHGDWNKIDPNNEPLCVYVVRDEDAVLYVGRSVDPFNRLLEHFGDSLRGSNARIGTFYKDFKHEADSWIIEMYSREECEKIVKEKCINANRAEVMMILHFKPCLNHMNNDNPSPLPEKYMSRYYPKNRKSIFAELAREEDSTGNSSWDAWERALKN